MIQDKKIMMITTTDNMIWQFLLPHIRHLQQLGNTVECVCARTGFWFDELKDKHKLVVHEIDFERNPLKLKNFKGYKKLKELQKERNFDLIYCQQPVGGMMGRLIGKKFKVPVIYTAHGFHFFKGCPLVNKLVYKPVEKWLSKYTDALITINEEDYQNALKMKAKQVYKINGIGFDNKKYEDFNASREKCREELGLKDEFTILTVAEFIERKNFSTMLKTINEIKNENIKFLICGRGKQQALIEQQIKELNLENKVELLGYRKDINKIMTASDLFYLPSHQEGLTLSIIEALNFGLPVVTSDVRGNKDLIEDGVGGFVCEQNDFKQQAEAILKIMTNEQLHKNMSETNLKNSEKYDISFVVDQLSEIYKNI